MSRRQQAMAHARDRLRLVAGVVVTVLRGATAVAEDISVMKVAADRMVTSEGVYLLESDEHAWMIGVDVLAGVLQVGDVIEVGTDRFRVVEGAATQRHWGWSDVDQTSRVYTTRQV